MSDMTYRDNTKSGSEKTQPVEGFEGGAKSLQIIDYMGDQEVVEVTTQTSTAAAVTLAGPASSGIKVVTVGCHTTATATIELVYVGFTGTPFNDPETAGLRRIVPMGSERTFVFSDDVLPTGVSLASNDAVGTGHVIYVEVTYA